MKYLLRKLCHGEDGNLYIELGLSNLVEKACNRFSQSMAHTLSLFFLIDNLDNGPFVNIFYKIVKTSAKLLWYTDLLINRLKLLYFFFWVGWGKWVWYNDIFGIYLCKANLKNMCVCCLLIQNFQAASVARKKKNLLLLSKKITQC